MEHLIFLNLSSYVSQTGGQSSGVEPRNFHAKRRREKYGSIPSAAPSRKKLNRAAKNGRNSKVCDWFLLA